MRILHALAGNRLSPGVCAFVAPVAMLGAILGVAAPATGQAAVAEVRLVNHTQFTRSQWVRTTVPLRQGLWWGTRRLGVPGHESILRPFGARWPDGSVRYGELFVRRSMVPGGEVVLDVVEGGGRLPRFALSPWVERGLADFGWQLIVGVPGVGPRLAGLRLVEWVDVSEVRVTGLFRARVPDTDLVYDLWLSFLHDQDHVPFELRLTCSNTASDRWNNPVDYVGLAVRGAYPNVRGAAHRGVEVLAPPTFDGNNLHLLLGSETLWDGQAQEWHGDLLFARPRASDTGTATRLATLAGVMECDLYGCATNWRESRAFGPFGVIPPDPAWITDGGRAAAGKERNAFFDWLARPAPAWADMPLGLRPKPGTTGDQHDFGAAKLVDIVAGGWPHRIEEARFNASEEAYRPVHHRNPDGSPVRSAQYRNWVAQNGRTHFSRIVSPDRLGKPFPEPWIDANGWGGKDDQHWSSLHLSAAYLLTGSHSLRAELDNEAELYLASHTLPSQRQVATNDIGATRAVGRTLLSMSWNYIVTGNWEVRTRMVERVRQCIVQQFIGLQVSGPVRPTTISAPDARVFPNDVFWKPWEEALAVLGLEACAAATGDQRAHQLAVTSAKTLIHYGWRFTSQESIVGTGIRWKPDGVALTGPQYESAEWVLWSYGTGFNEWSLSAMRLALAYGQRYADPSLISRSTAILQRLYQRRREPADGGWDRFAEWEAVPFQ